MFPRRPSSYVLALLLLSLSCFLSAARAQVGGEFTDLEAYVAQHPGNLRVRHQLARAYAKRGFVEEAVAQDVAILDRQRDDAEVRKELQALCAQQMPAWLPAAAAAVKPFRLTALDVQFPDPARPKQVEWFHLLTTTDFAAPEEARHDPRYGWPFPRVSYGYVWEPARQRWQMKVCVHHSEGYGDLVRGTLRTTLGLYVLVKSYLHCDPAGEWNRPLDIWLAKGGPPGARTIGHDIYLYAIDTQRVPEEWLREVAHEYGHASLPGVGGFTKTDDPWADGDLAELLFMKWLAAAKHTDWLPWPVAAAEAIARPQREKLMAAARGRPDPARLAGTDEKARSYFLGLALHIEAKAGPRFLGAALARAPHARAAQVIATADRLAEERGMKLW